MLNICKKIADDNNECGLIGAGAQIALFATYFSDGRTCEGYLQK